MKLFKNSLLTLLCFCCMIFIFSCTDEGLDSPEQTIELPSDIQSPMSEQVTDGETAANRTWICWEMMSYISFGNVPECAEGAASLLETAFYDYVNSPSGYDVYLSMYYQIYLWGVMVNCDPDECENCTDYLATAQLFADCLEDNNSPYAGGLEWIIDFLEGKCDGCPVDECCPDAVFEISKSADENGCCRLTLTFDFPEECGQVTVNENQYEDLSIRSGCESRVYVASGSTTYTFCCDEEKGNGQRMRFHAVVGGCDIYTDYEEIGGC